MERINERLNAFVALWSPIVIADVCLVGSILSSTLQAPLAFFGIALLHIGILTRL